MPSVEQGIVYHPTGDPRFSSDRINQLLTPSNQEITNKNYLTFETWLNGLDEFLKGIYSKEFKVFSDIKRDEAEEGNELSELEKENLRRFISQISAKGLASRFSHTSFCPKALEFLNELDIPNLGLIIRPETNRGYFRHFHDVSNNSFKPLSLLDEAVRGNIINLFNNNKNLNTLSLFRDLEGWPQLLKTLGRSKQINLAFWTIREQQNLKNVLDRISGIPDYESLTQATYLICDNPAQVNSWMKDLNV